MAVSHVLGIEPRLLEGQPVFLTAESSFMPLYLSPLYDFQEAAHLVLPFLVFNNSQIKASWENVIPICIPPISPCLLNDYFQCAMA